MSSGPRWRRAVVTGASSGIGTEFARQLAAAGTDLVLVARTKGRLEALASELADTHGRDVEVLPADLAEATQLAQVEERVASHERPVDLVVNNAGFAVSGSFASLDVDEVEGQVLVDVLAVTRLTHAALRRMRGVGEGGVLNISSGVGFLPTVGSSVYSASKAFVTSLGQALHEELRGTGVTVTTLCPGFTRTEFQARGGYDATQVPGFMWMSAVDVARAGLDGVASGRSVVVPGAVNQVMLSVAQLLPRTIPPRIVALTSRTG